MLYRFLTYSHPAVSTMEPPILVDAAAETNIIAIVRGMSNKGTVRVQPSSPPTCGFYTLCACDLRQPPFSLQNREISVFKSRGCEYFFIRAFYLFQHNL